MAKLILAVVLADIASHGLKAGQLLEAQPDTINALAKAGEVDPHKDAVAYARSTGVQPVRSSIELRAAEREAQLDALRVRIAELQALAASAQDEPTKAALAAELGAKQAALQALLQA